MTHAFPSDATTDDVLQHTDLTHKRVFVTGMSAGLGAETARALAMRGAHVIGTARDTTKADAVRTRINDQARAHGGSLTVLPLDLADLSNVRAVTDQLTADRQPLDLIIANAGIMATPFSRTRDGFELQFGTNHLGHFVLVNRLAPLLEPGGRAVMLSSAAHRFADVNIEDPSFDTTPYDAWVAYGRSKTANALFAVAFDQRHRQRGVRATAVHPGLIATELARGVSAEDWQAFTDRTSRGPQTEDQPLTYKTIPQGAATTVWAGVAAPADEVGGRYCENLHVSPVIPAGSAASAGWEGVMAYAADADSAERLWRKSEELVNERFS